MIKFLLRNFLFAILLTACSTASHNTGGENFSNYSDSEDNYILAAARRDTAISFPDTLAGDKPLSLMDLPQSQEGEIVLSPGFYEADFKSYCLQPGTPSPGDGDAYMQEPLTSYRKDIVETVLRNSLKKPDIEQRNIQLLLWSIVSGSDFRKLSWEVQATANQLLSRKQIFQLKGGVIGIVKTISTSLPETGATSKLKQLFEAGTSSYELFERVAVLQQTSEFKKADIEKDQWYKQDGGYYLRYFPSSYQHVKIQVYVPETAYTSATNAGDYLLFDPVTMMAIPTHSNSQRLGIGAPVIDVIRKIIEIQSIPKPTPKPPVKVKNPKTGVST